MSRLAVLPTPRTRAITGRDVGTWLGIDIGASAIKLAQVAKRRDGWTLNVSHLIPVGPRPLDRAALDQNQVLELFRERLQRMARPAARDAACVLSAALIGLTTVELPPGTPEETRSMIAAELVAQGDVEPEFGYFENTGANTSGMLQYTVVSIPTNTAGAVAEDLWQLGYACQAIDGLPCIHVRAAVLADRSSLNETVAILDWGATSPILTIASRGRPVFTRLLKDCGVNTIVQPIARRIGFETDEMHELLMASGQSQSFGSPAAAARSNEILKDITDRALQRMEGELQRTLKFLQRQGKELVPSRIILIGGGSLFPGIAEQLTGQARLPVSLFRLPGPQSTEKQPEPMQAVFASAIAASTLGGTV